MQPPTYMVYIEYPENTTGTLDVPFYLATEEYVATRLMQPGGEFLFLWQVEPTVIFGRNQSVHAEVNLEYCQQNNVQTFRRKSGGGCVYADLGNVMVSYVTDGDNVVFNFNRYTTMLIHALRCMGVTATASGRNDILVDGRKVSGSAYYLKTGRSIVHGTLLYDTDMPNMVNSITPSAEKLAKNGVQSVRQRIGLLKDYTDMTLDEIKTHIRQLLCKEQRYTLTDKDLAEIGNIRSGYLKPSFIYGKL